MWFRGVYKMPPLSFAIGSFEQMRPKQSEGRTGKAASETVWLRTQPLRLTSLLSGDIDILQEP